MQTPHYGALPAVHRFMDDVAVAAFEEPLGRTAVRTCVQEALAEARSAMAQRACPPPNYASLRGHVLGLLSQREASGLIGVINGSGVLLHTNFGRAPLAKAAVDAVRDLGGAYNNLEYDLKRGERGERYDRVASQLRELSGAPGALVVNNCAAAILLVLDTFARGREVVVSRGQLIEIGGSFRLPDVLSRSGATVVEVGTTNRTYADDYRTARTDRTAIFMRTHASNFRMSGFTAQVGPGELAAVAAESAVIAFEDLGSGALIDLSRFGLPHEPTVAESIAAGLDLVAFSGDKLLGGPQCGILCGRADLVERMKRNPLLRALRVDKMTLAALAATLACYCKPDRLLEIPLFAMLAEPESSLRRRAQLLCAQLRAGGSAAEFEVRPTTSITGGGALPCVEIPSVALCVGPQGSGPAGLARKLRTTRPPVIGRIEETRLVLDMRTIFPEQDGVLCDLLAGAV